MDVCTAASVVVSVSHLEFIGHVLLVERIQADEFEALRHDVERLVVSFRAHGHLVRADL